MNKVSLFSLVLCINLIVGLKFPTTSEHPSKPRTASTTKKFVPTNTWYQNLLVGTGKNPVHTYPYLLTALDTGLRICYATQMVNQNAYIFEVNIANLVLSVRESFNAPSLDSSTVDQDEFNLGIKINFGKFDVRVTRGVASIVANINSATPALRTIHAIMSNQKISDRVHKFSLNNGQTWLVQTQSSLEWTSTNDEIFARSTYSGWLKISIVPNAQAETALISAHDLVITNGRVTYSVDRSDNQVMVKINYNSQGLYYLLPHVINPTDTQIISGAFAKGIKGTYLLSRGLGYHYKIPVFDSDFKPETILNSPDKIQKLREALQSDVNLEIDSKDPYFGGKELARTARLIEIADLLGDDSSKLKAKNLLVNELDDFWFGIKNNTPALVYEPTWGGIVSRRSVGSMETDFGIYYYNDHHFHFGYFINAAATLAKHYPDYYQSRVDYFNLILSDYAGVCFYKELPCKPRNKDPFLGHSFAAGIFEFADSRNQESTSEAINSYLAVKELARALKNNTLLDLADYLLSTEIVATKVYWQIRKDSQIYSEPFSKNGVVGILWETKVDYATFFGINVEFIYGIQMLPFNEITPQHLDKDWLRETKPIWGTALNNGATEEGWRGFLLLADAIIDPTRSGLSESIHNLKSYDNGNTRTNTLYFYYMVGGATSSSSVVPITVSPGGSTMSTSPTTTNCTGSNCALTDTGKPNPACGSNLYGCHNNNDNLIGCYDPANSVCFIGGNLCPKPLLACVNLSSPNQGAACYDSSVYSCNNGILSLNNIIG